MPLTLEDFMASQGFSKPKAGPEPVRSIRRLLGPGRYFGEIFVNPDGNYFLEDGDASFSELRGEYVMHQIRRLAARTGVVKDWYDHFKAEVIVPEHPLEPVLVFSIEKT